MQYNTVYLLSLYKQIPKKKKSRVQKSGLGTNYKQEPTGDKQKSTGDHQVQLLIGVFQLGTFYNFMILWYCLETLSQSYFLCVPFTWNGIISGMTLNAGGSSILQQHNVPVNTSKYYFSTHNWLVCIDWENCSLFQIHWEKNSLFWIRIILYQWFTGVASNEIILHKISRHRPHGYATTMFVKNANIVIWMTR